MLFVVVVVVVIVVVGVVWGVVFPGVFMLMIWESVLRDKIVVSEGIQGEGR